MKPRDLDAIKRVVNPEKAVYYHALSPNEIVAYTMKKMGATYQDIGDVFGTSRQFAEQVIKKANAKIEGGE